MLVPGKGKTAQARLWTYVIETAKLNGIEPQAYIADGTEKIASGWPASRWDEFMLWNWTAGRAPVSMAA